jgi:hypothetical protein
VLLILVNIDLRPNRVPRIGLNICCPNSQQPGGMPTPRELRRRYPTIRIPIYIRHPGIVYTFWTILVRSRVPAAVGSGPPTARAGSAVRPLPPAADKHGAELL